MALRALTVALGQDNVSHLLPEDVEQDYLGGRGAIAWLFTNWFPAETAPLSAENILVFAAGLLAGTHAFATGGFVVGTRSPLTGSIGYSWAQGHWGAALRQSGYDLLVVSGQAPDWCFIQIDGDHVQVSPAKHLLGLDTRATAAALQAELGTDYVVLCVGPAAESEVAYCSIVAEDRYMAEPAGTGAVMAHKRVKAIAVRSGSPLPALDEPKLQIATDIIRKRTHNSALAKGIRQFGSMHYLERAMEWGALTGRNGQAGYVNDKLNSIAGTLSMRETSEDRGCTECPMPCYFDVVLRTGQRMPRPELELVAGFNARCGITSPDALLAIADLCLRLGLDPAATSAAIAFMMECQEKNLNRSGTLPWGDDDAVILAIERLGQRQDKRDVLSLGVGEMQEIFWGSATFAPQVKGLAMPALDPRALTGAALAMATAPIGGDYRYAMAYEELSPEPPPWLPDEPSHPHAVKGKVLRLIWHERYAAVLDSVGVCRRLGLMAYQVSPGELIALINAVTGRSLDGAELARIGERIVTVERVFARRYCDNGCLDDLPSRWREIELEEGRAAGHLPPLLDLVAEYYRRHGWGSMGDPTPARMAELGIHLKQE
jgi:aldehyde:ferredoxin oxidoreductase